MIRNVIRSRCLLLTTSNPLSLYVVRPSHLFARVGPFIKDHSTSSPQKGRPRTFSQRDHPTLTPHKTTHFKSQKNHPPLSLRGTLQSRVNQTLFPTSTSGHYPPYILPVTSVRPVTGLSYSLTDPVSRPTHAPVNLVLTFTEVQTSLLIPESFVRV